MVASNGNRAEVLHLDPALERAAKAKRDRRHHVAEIPRLRALGFVMLTALVALHQRLETEHAYPLGVAAFGALAGAYTAASWFVLLRSYRFEAPLHLGRFFLLADLVPLGTAVWATGGSHSWLFLLPYLRVFDQLHIGVRWCLTCSAAAVTTHLSVIALDQWTGVDGPLGTELLKLVTCATMAFYVSLTSLTAEKLRRRNSRTVAIARDLVRELEEQKADLDRARRDAESAAVAKGTFLATMSHEIRTPMNGVIGMIELALDAADERERRELLLTARSSADALLQVIGDVLDFSKIEAGHLRVEAAPFEPRELVRQTTQVLGVLARGKGVALDWSLGADVPAEVVGDATRTRQVLLNLLGNAVKFTERGAVTVTVTRVKDAHGRDAVAYAVSDTGIGIAKEQHQAIFEAFTQAEMSTSRRFGGTGLGLAISRRLAELMGGTLEVASALGQGSTFTLTLPQAAVVGARASASANAPVTTSGVADPPAPLPAPRPLGGRVAASRRTARPLAVLLVEDNPVNQRVAKSLLERWGHTVTVAENGRVALERATATRFDVILMDLQMPELDGLEATRRLRARGDRARSGARLPIIAMTANALEDDRARCLAAGMDDYMAKPIDPARLFELLEAIPGATGAAA